MPRQLGVSALPRTSVWLEERKSEKGGTKRRQEALTCALIIRSRIRIARVVRMVHAAHVGRTFHTTAIYLAVYIQLCMYTQTLSE